jgi:hypothetical protein
MSQFSEWSRNARSPPSELLRGQEALAKAVGLFSRWRGRSARLVARRAERLSSFPDEPKGAVEWPAVIFRVTTWLLDSALRDQLGTVANEAEGCFSRLFDSQMDRFAGAGEEVSVIWVGLSNCPASRALAMLGTSPLGLGVRSGIAARGGEGARQGLQGRCTPRRFSVAGE